MTLGAWRLLRYNHIVKRTWVIIGLRIATTLTLLAVVVTPLNAKDLGIADQDRIVRVAMGSVGFRPNSVGLERCNQAKSLDYAANALAFDQRAIAVVLRLSALHGERSGLAHERLHVVHRYLVEERGVDPGRILVQTSAPRDIVDAPDWQPVVTVTVLLRARYPGEVLTIDDDETIGYP